VFYYYGRKKQIAKYYPSPECEAIVEPFAGSAAYSLHGSNWEREVFLIEKDARICDIWRWLIEEATPASIEALPSLSEGQKSSEFLHILHAATKMAFKYKTIKVTPVLERNWEISKRVMAASLYKVKHWKMIEGDFGASPDVVATWFVDPPYKGDAGMGYGWNSAMLDYDELATWVLGRRGQIICCEGAQGDYLPFKCLLSLPGVAGKRSQEKIFHRSLEMQLELACAAA